MRPGLDELTAAGIALAVERGLRDRAIAELRGVSLTTIRRWRRELGIVCRATPARPVSDQRLRALWAEGLRNRAIARRSGLTLRTVQERLSRLGLRSHRDLR